MRDVVSVGFLVYNDAAFLRSALNSLLTQTHQNLEIIICDDCSTDGSAEICAEYAALDSRIKYFRHPANIGISRNMEFALAQATGKFFFWAADDDCWAPTFVEAMVTALDAHGDSLVAFGPYQQMNEAGDTSAFALRTFDYSDPDPAGRLRKLAAAWDDGFGYGLFRRELIADVRFPVWWGVNSVCAYENIFPSLCLYLARGNFCFVPGPPLWFNRIKDAPHHRYPFSEQFRSALAAILRKFNLHVKCLQGVLAGSGSLLLIMQVYPAFARRLLDGILPEVRVLPGAFAGKLGALRHRVANRRPVPPGSK